MNNAKLNDELFLGEGVVFCPLEKDFDMNKNERFLISSLIKFYEPQNILEIGVGDGYGCTNILNTIKDMDTKLVSIDAVEIFEHPYRGKIKVAEQALKLYENHDNWKLILGHDPSEIVDSLYMDFDFMILDTAHLHPIESLNFISVLNKLKEDAIVVLHDTSVYMDSIHYKGTLDSYACRILMGGICAEKYIPNFVGAGGFYSNMLVFRMSGDTKKYIRNVFELLALPWEVFPDTLPYVYRIVKNNYNSEELKLFEDAIKMNFDIEYMYWKKNANVILSIIKKHKLIIYGAGNKFTELSNYFGKLLSDDDIYIWDIKGNEALASEIYVVSKPNYEDEVNGIPMIVTIENDEIYASIEDIFTSLGYRVYHSLYLCFITELRKFEG